MVAVIQPETEQARCGNEVAPRLWSEGLDGLISDGVIEFDDDVLAEIEGCTNGVLVHHGPCDGFEAESGACQVDVL